ncbi:MAG: PIG-L family deacetylase, partial [Winogradskyella sp.]|nr:PIG-L family deacetylase [Winogradskyella sp.]
MHRLKLTLVLLTLPIFVLSAQQPKKLNSSEIYEAIQKLNVLGSALYVAAHPDDENTRLISYLSNQLKVQTTYLSMTRGDGGQNLIGPELGNLLGIIRTQELLAARSIDGGEQRFTRANDFGYSKHPEETLKIWNENEVLADVVWAIRTFKPDVIINRFDHRTPGTTHGHHTSSAILSEKAFDLANDPTKYTEQLEYTTVWQPKRLYFNTTPWFYRSREDFDKANAENRVTVDIGVYYPIKGLSNNEIAALASSQHLCQGFGRLTQRGSQNEYLEFIKGEPYDTNAIFAGIDTSWNRIAGGDQIANILMPLEQSFNFQEPSSHLPQLLEAYKYIRQLEDTHWRDVKTKEIKAIISACAGLYLEASANSPTASKKEQIDVTLEVINRSDASISLISYNLTSLEQGVEKNMVLRPNEKLNFKEAITITNDLNYTTPYWLNKRQSLGMYNVDDQELRGLPETPRAVNVEFNLLINDTPITFKKPVVYRYSKPDEGELYRPFEITPAVTASISNKVIIFENDQPKDIEVLVKAGRDKIEGFVKMAYPNDWSVYPNQQKINIKTKNEIQKLVFTVIPPKDQSEGYMTPMVNVDGEFFTDELVEINYDHIPFQTVLLPSLSKVVRLNIKKQGANIGYIEGAGDAIPESLRQIGYTVTIIDPNSISSSNLSEFDAIITGIRAYNVVDDLKFKQKFLFDYVANGGNLIIQYNTSRGLIMDELA